VATSLQAHDVERDGLIGIATETTDFKVKVTRIERVAERGRRLRRTLEGKHALGPGVAGELVGLTSPLGSPVSRHSDGGAVKPVAGFGAHDTSMAARGGRGKPLHLAVRRPARPNFRSREMSVRSRGFASALAVARVAVVKTVAEEVAEAFEKQSKAARSQRGRASPSAWPRGYAGA